MVENDGLHLQKPCLAQEFGVPAARARTDSHCGGELLLGNYGGFVSAEVTEDAEQDCGAWPHLLKMLAVDNVFRSFGGYHRLWSPRLVANVFLGTESVSEASALAGVSVFMSV
ncbi:hypothetical protein BHQ23_08505 [Mycobacterium gordonae]|uniref:Uncharacterized protein n=1 Tax=Mycobacterium gordonae TaxID=1778 RepID=A0A1X1X111_MYCGO|nr:hypothetical protein BHQ23_08505 [Mycobacterium gordonae]ORV92566.1 hypothetical protein AWC08_19600 [Mycobacterium gordonae]